MTPARCAPEATVTTRSVTCGSSRLVNAKWPRWLVPNCSSKPSAVRPAGTIMIPALLTRTWSGPVQASANARTEARSARPRGGPSTRPGISAAAARPRSRSRTARTTEAPAVARACAVARPRPLVAPVTTTVRPSWRGMSAEVQRLVMPGPTRRPPIPCPSRVAITGPRQQDGALRSLPGGTRAVRTVPPFASKEARVSDGLYVTACEAGTGRAAVSLGLFDLLVRRVDRLGVFRPVVSAVDGSDPSIDLLLPRLPQPEPYEACLGVPYAEVLADEDKAMSEIVERFRALAARCDSVFVVGSDFTEAGAARELALNARIAANLGLPVVCVVSGHDRAATEVRAAADVGVAAMRAAGCEVVAVVANRVDPGELAGVTTGVTDRGVSVYALPESPVLTAPTMAEIADACEAALLTGDASILGRETSGVLVAAMTLPNVLDRLYDEVVVITPGDRAAALMGGAPAHLSGGEPTPAGVVLTGGLPPTPHVLQLLERLPTGLPVVLTKEDTYVTTSLAASVPGRIAPDASRKIDTALALFEAHVDGAALLDRAAVSRPTVRTPLMFEHELLDQARADRRRIVLPEGTEERVLRAADTLLRRGVVDLTLVGGADEIRAAAARAGVSVDGAQLLDPCDPELRERMAVEYARRREHKGVTMDAARDVVVDVSYFGTLLVALGMADGMVSGAVHTTAQTIRPSLELIRTVEGVSIVSSVFFMCLADRVLVYGDCAVNVHPTAEQLAEIAISSAVTAAQFGVEPRVAMLSYSTGRSGSGEGVERVRSATSVGRERARERFWEGPIQYDAAVDLSVARTKLPDSEVAGRATVFVFPDLNTGNNTYKAVQRSAGAVAVGPVLQGLRRPVNDLSRGATVQDIVNTVAITAIQAQNQVAP